MMASHQAIGLTVPLDTRIFYAVNQFARDTPPWLQPIVAAYANYGTALFAALILAAGGSPAVRAPRRWPPLCGRPSGGCWRYWRSTSRSPMPSPRCVPATRYTTSSCCTATPMPDSRATTRSWPVRRRSGGYGWYSGARHCRPARVGPDVLCAGVRGCPLPTRCGGRVCARGGGGGFRRIRAAATAVDAHDRRRLGKPAATVGRPAAKRRLGGRGLIGLGLMAVRSIDDVSDHVGIVGDRQ